jgi:RNA recognition motif-containing protein
MLLTLQVIRHADGSNRGFGFVNFTDEEAMKAAMAQMNDARVPHIPAFENRQLKVKPSEKNQNFAQQQRQQQQQQHQEQQ